MKKSTLPTSQSRRENDDSKLRIGIFIVTYNAENEITRVLQRIPDSVWNKVSEIYLFDDSSSDLTVETTLKFEHEKKDKIKIYRNNVNLGYGGNQKRGYLYAQDHDFDIVVLLHGDGQYAPEELSNMIAPIENGEADAVFGSRMMIPNGAKDGGMPFYKRIGNRILSTLQNSLLNTNLTEFHSGYRAYRVAALKQLPLLNNTNDFHFDTQIIIQLLDAGFRIKEIPIPVYYGDEICRVNGMKYAYDVVKSTVKYRMHKTGLFRYPEYQILPAEVKYTYKHNKFSSHSRIISYIDDLPAAKTVLDVGSGVGLLSQKMQDKGLEPYGVDVYPLDEEHQKNFKVFIQANVDDGLTLPVKYENFFDVLVFADILEHLNSPQKVLEDSLKYLKDDGYIIASTGNVAHIFIRLMLLLGKFDYTEKGILDKTHKMLFTKKTFSKLFKNVGYSVVEKQYTPIPFENIFLNKKLSDTLSSIYIWFVRLLPGLFSYQFVYKLEKDPQFELEERRLSTINSPYVAEEMDIR